MFLEIKKKAEETKKILELLRFQAMRIIPATICMGIVALATAAYAYLVGPVIRSLFESATPIVSDVPQTHQLLNQITEHLNRSPVWFVALLIVFTSLIKGIAFFAQRILTISAGQHILVALRLKLYRGILKMNPFHTDSKTPGELITRFTVDVETVEHAATNGLLAFVRDGLQIIALAALALILSPTLGLLGLIAFPPIGFAISRIGRTLRKRKGRMFDAFSEMGTLVEETTTGLPVIQDFNAHSLVTGRFRKQNSALMKKAVSALSVKAFSSPLNEFLGAGALAATLWFAHQQIAGQSLTPAAFISFFTALFLLYQPVKGIGQAAHAIQTGLAALDRLTPIMNPSSAQQPQLEQTVGPKDQLSFHQFTGGYESNRDILKDISLTLKKGEITALVGPSGCGKSTLINALRGYVSVTDGHIEAPPSDSHPIIAVVPQEPFLFNDTIAMNVLCGNENATTSEVQTACENAGVTRFSNDLPHQLDTPVGAKGTALSVGQRQRVCLARALISNTPFLLLDEVTASLDGETEQNLIRSISDAIKAKGVLVVTHRPSTAAWADRVILMENGRIVLDGPSDQLMKHHNKLRLLFGDQPNKGTSRD